MANEKLKVKKGKKANLPAKEAGSLVFATDTQEMFLDVSGSERIRMGQGKDSSSSSGRGIKEFVYDAAHSSSNSYTYNSLISDTTIEVNDLLLLNFEDDSVLYPSRNLGTLNSIPTRVDTLCRVNKYSKVLFRVVSISNNVISLKRLGELLPALSKPQNDAIEVTIANAGTEITHKELLTTGTPDTTYGDLVTETNLKKTLNVPKVSVDKYGHVVNIQEISVNANFREDTLTDQTSAQYRNIVVVPSTTNLSTLDVPVGTIIFVKP